MTAVEILERKADEYQALANEHNNVAFWIVETVLREVAKALEEDEVLAA